MDVFQQLFAWGMDFFLQLLAWSKDVFLQLLDWGKAHPDQVKWIVGVIASIIAIIVALYNGWNWIWGLGTNTKGWESWC